MKTILVTGGAGFIGSNFIHFLYNKYPDYRIIVVDALTYAGQITNLPHGAFGKERYEFWYGNVCNSALINDLVAQADIVVHMAAETHVTRSIYDNLTFFETDVLGTQAVANAVVNHRNKVELFIHISTSEVYGTAISSVIDEDHPLNPMSPYAAAKAGADRLVYSYWQTYDIPAVIVRPFNNYGPRQHLEKAVPRFITSCLLEDPLTVHGNGDAARDWIYVEETCRALDCIIHADKNKIVGEVFNVGTGQHRTVAEIAKLIRETMGNPVNSPIHFIGDRPGQVIRHTAGIDKIKQVLGWSTDIHIEDKIADTIQWYKDNRAWWQAQLWMRHIPIITAAGKRELH